MLLANEGYTDEAIAERAGMSLRGAGYVRQRFVEDGFEVTLEGKPRGHRPRALTGEDEARLITLVCGPVPEGCARWTLRLLEDKRVTLENTDTKAVSRETIRRTLKPWQSREWCIPPEGNAEFATCMEDALDVYTRE